VKRPTSRTAGKTLPNGRSKYPDGGYLQLHRFMLNTPAWRDLSTQDRCVYIEIAAIYTGANNGFLGASARRLAELCGISKDTAARSVRNLIDHGFIECLQEAAFHVKTRLAPEFRLTQFRCDRTRTPASKAFLKWRPGTAGEKINGPKRGTLRSQTRDSEVLHAA